MITFTCVMEVWHEESIQYMNVEFKGGDISLPSQDSPEDREDIVEKANLAYPNVEILDLVGVVQGDQTIWKDIEHGSK